MIRHWETGKTCHAKVAGARLPARFERLTQMRWRHLRTLTDPTARVRER